ncbi:MAG TPA: type I-U CRISPR-associated protein Csb2, partial [Rhizomicrobium sp.]
MPTLLIAVRFHDGRYHGRPDWPPSPARLFQALVAGAAQGKTLATEDKDALKWLEGLKDAPMIAAPPMRRGQPFTNFVPNNDRDSVESKKFKNHRDYLAALGKIRTAKDIRPILFEAEMPLFYVWTFYESPEARTNAQQVCAIAERLYQFGRGVDMAWAWGEVLDVGKTDARLAAQGGVLHRPSNRAGGAVLAVPLNGSLESLIERHKKAGERFRTLYESKPTQKEPDRKVATGQVFVQPPKPLFRNVSYDSPPVRKLFDLRDPSKGTAEPPFAPWALTDAVSLVEKIRDMAAARLKKQPAANEAQIDRVLVGRDATEADKGARVRIIPLPSIGSDHVDRAIRRVLIEIPPDCCISADDIAWSFSGLDVITDTGTGEIKSILSPADDYAKLRHYGIGEKHEARLWRTVTPAALPHGAARHRQRTEQKDAAARLCEEGKAVAAVRQALRHAGIAAPVETIRVQREPFTRHGERAESFATPPRFTRERLWHVEIAFKDPVRGPLVIGDGRYLG